MKTPSHILAAGKRSVIKTKRIRRLVDIYTTHEINEALLKGEVCIEDAKRFVADSNAASSAKYFKKTLTWGENGIPVIIYKDTRNTGQINKIFLSRLSEQAKEAILQSIATHYGSTLEDIFEEVTDDEAEHLLDYMTEPERSAASVLMQKYKRSLLLSRPQTRSTATAYFEAPHS